MKGSAQENVLKTLILSYQEAPVGIRENFTFNDEEAREFLLFLKENFSIREALLISTCNRTELYYIDALPQEEMVKVLASFKSFPSGEIAPFFRILDDTSESARHLLRVGIGLESQVLGDLQVINQVKVAYQLSADLDLAGPFLHRLLHALFFMNKRVVQETRFRSGSASVSYAAKELAEDLLHDKKRQVCVLGLGEIGIAVLKNLQENGFHNLVICNRSIEKALPYLNEQTRFVPFSEAEACVRESALVISALSGQILQIGPEWLENTQINGYQYFIDLGMPRSVLPEIESLPHAILYNIDQIQSKVNEALQMRREAIPAVEAIIETGLEEFLDWNRDMAVSPVIQQMRNSLEILRKEEMARFTRKVGEEHAAWAEELTKNLMQRIMKTHVIQLKAACRRGDAENLVEVLQQLFQVEENTKA